MEDDKDTRVLSRKRYRTNVDDHRAAPPNEAVRLTTDNTDLAKLSDAIPCRIFSALSSTYI